MDDKGRCPSNGMYEYLPSSYPGSEISCSRSTVYLQPSQLINRVRCFAYFSKTRKACFMLYCDITLTLIMIICRLNKNYDCFSEQSNDFFKVRCYFVIYPALHLSLWPIWCVQIMAILPQGWIVFAWSLSFLQVGSGKIKRELAYLSNMAALKYLLPYILNTNDIIQGRFSLHNS